MKIIVLSLCATLLLAGCGVKPSNIDPPPGVSKNAFPKVYPDPKTDPGPKTP